METNVNNSTEPQHETILPVKRNFCVSLVFLNVHPGGVFDMALRSSVVEALSQEEALGLMIMRMTEFKNWQLYLKCIVPL